MTDIDMEFVRKPREFLETNYIYPMDSIIRGTIPKASGAGFKKIVTGYFTLTERNHTRAGGKAKRAFNLDFSSSPKPDQIWAYWLAYEANKSKHAVLGADAEFMFTCHMSGCTFGYGSRTSSGHVVVGHANSKDFGDEAQKIAEEEFPNDLAKAKIRERELTWLNQKLKLSTNIRKTLDKVDLETFVHRCRSEGFSDPEIQAMIQQGLHIQEIGGSIKDVFTGGKKGPVRIIHETVRKNEETINIHETKNYFDPAHTTEKAKDPTISEYQSTVVGLRERGQWNFVCQRRAMTQPGGLYVLRDVVDI